MKKEIDTEEMIKRLGLEKKPKLNLYGVVQRLKIIIKLFFVYIKWCFNDCVENYQDIKFRYKMETDKELLEMQKELENL
jgi:hypothetical protein